MECIIDYTNSNIMYGALYYGDVRKSTNGGNSFSSMFPVVMELGKLLIY